MTDHDVRYPPTWRLPTTAQGLRASTRFSFRGIEGIESTSLILPDRLPACPEGGEGFVAIPQPEILADQSSVRNIPDRTSYQRAYLFALQRFREIAEPLGWCVHDYLSHEEGLDYYADTVGVAYTRMKERDGPVAIFPVQMGLLYAGMSPVDVRAALIPKVQFPLDPMTVAWILGANFVQIHNALDAHPATMYVDCPGGMYAPTSGARHLDTPRFEIDFARRMIRIDWNFEIRSRHCHGSATGWLV